MTEARKRWKRTGRARLPGVREANGQLKRETVEDIKGVVKAARKRQGIPDKWLDNPDVETEHGKMRLSRELSQDQWAAAEWYLDCRWLNQSAFDLPGIECERKSGTGDPDAHVRFCGKARALWDGIIACLRDAGVQSRSPIEPALDVILWRNKPMPHMNGDLKLGLNALVRFRRNMC